MQDFVKNEMSKFGPKDPLFGYFLVRILKNYGHMLIQDPGIYETAKFYQKMKMPKFGSKNALARI